MIAAFFLHIGGNYDRQLPFRYKNENVAIKSKFSLYK